MNLVIDVTLAAVILVGCTAFWGAVAGLLIYSVTKGLRSLIRMVAGHV